MPSTTLYGTPYNGDSVPLLVGHVVRTSTDNRVVRAQADSAAHSAALCGVVASGQVGVGGPVNVVSAALRQFVRLETGLTPSASQPLYLSETTPGCATTNATGSAIVLGTVEDASAYARTGGVYATVFVPAAAFSGGAQPLIATWATPVDGTTTNMRWYALDGTNGNDNNVGYSDTSAADAGKKAVKTQARLNQIFPIDGKNRAATILVNAGTYADVTSFLIGRSGYWYLLARATCTDATAGSVAFADDTNDRQMNGNVTATGMNAAGYNPTGTPTNQVIQCLKVGGGAPGFPAEVPISLPGGARLRFAINTPTPQLQGVRVPVIAVAGGDTLTLSKTLPAVPTSSDVFYLEMPGVTFIAIQTDGHPCGTQQTGIGAGFVSGFNANGTAEGARQIDLQGSWTLCNCWASGTTNASSVHGGAASLNSGYALPTAFNFETGGCCRSIGGFSLFQTIGYSETGGGTGPYCNSVSATRVGSCVEYENSFVCVSGMTWSGITSPAKDSAVTVSGTDQDPDCIGTNLLLISQGAALSRILGAGTFAGLLVESDAVIIGLSIIGCGSKPAIKLRCANKAIVVGNQLTGSAGNTDVGLDMTNAQNCKVYIQLAPSVTGTTGDIRLADGTIVTWATAMAGITDSQGNQFWGPNNFPLHFQSVPSGAVTVTWNNAPTGSGAAPQRYLKIPDGQGGFWTFGSLT